MVSLSLSNSLLSPETHMVASDGLKAGLRYIRKRENTQVNILKFYCISLGHAQCRLPVRYGNVCFYYYAQHWLSVYITVDISSWMFAAFYSNAFSGAVL